MGKLRIPSDYRRRLKDVASAHGFASADALAQHLIEKGLATYAPPPGTITEQLPLVVDDQGYADEEELIEHLLERGLRAYEEPADSPEQLAERLRGLGYIE